MIQNALINILCALIIVLCLPYDLGAHLLDALEATWIDMKDQWNSRLAYKNKQL